MVLCTITCVCVCVCVCVWFKQFLILFLQKEEHVKMQARHLALGEEVRRRIIQLRKLKK
jgi:hypothetical protein